jgi:hypothetical protein
MNDYAKGVAQISADHQIVGRIFGETPVGVWCVRFRIRPRVRCATLGFEVEPLRG